MTVLQKNIIKSVSISLPLIGLAFWAKAYFLIPVIIATIFIFLHRHEINTITKAINRLPAKLRILVKLSLCVVFGIGLAVYIIAFVTDVEIFTSISSNRSQICFLNKLKYGAVVDKDHRTQSLGAISRGNFAIVSIGDSLKTTMRIAAIPGDEFALVNGCAIVNGSSDSETPRATARFHVFHTTPLNIVHQLQRHTKELVDSAFRTVSIEDPICTLPVKETYNKWQKFTYCTIYNNYPDPRVFPHSLVPNNGLHMKAIVLPRKDQSFTFNHDNVDYLFSIISHYEVSDAVLKDGIVYINGQRADDYTFMYDYYFLLNDNREVLNDSRIWGPVPEYCIIGSTSNFVL